MIHLSVFPFVFIICFKVFSSIYSLFGFPPQFPPGLGGFLSTAKAGFSSLPSSYRKEVFSTACRSCRSSKCLPKKSSFRSGSHDYQSTYYRLYTQRTSRPRGEVIVMSWQVIKSRDLNQATTREHHRTSTRCTLSSAIQATAVATIRNRADE